MSILSRFFGDQNQKHLKTLQPMIDKINALEPEMEKLNNTELKAKTQEFKSRLDKGETLEDILPEAFACVREAAKKTLGQRHFDVQLMGGIVLHRGEIAEMRTGEGKTLTSTLPMYLNSLSGAGAHLVTVNDYLAKRDTVWMGQIYEALGLSISSIQHDAAFMYDPNQQSKTDGDLDKERDDKGNFEVVEEFLRPCTRKEAYEADITYGTNNEFGFDYLRDNLVHDLKDKSQRDFNYAIVDEVDSILIDEARTPLIISGPAEESADMYNKFAVLVKTLKENEDYNIEEKQRAANLTEVGIAKVEKSLGMGNIYTEGGIKMVHHLEQALRAETLFKKDKDYVVKEDEVVIVDEFTGRMMPGRRYSEGLHQAIEAKEGAKVQRESITLATVTFQNYFRMYKKLSGMTGTAETSAEEFHKVYNLDVTVLPTNKPMVRNDMTDKVYKNEQGKFKAVVADVKEHHEKGQPVLIGTVSIEKNEILSEMLEREGVPHEMLNAKNHQKEGSIIAQAGRKAGVTLATNMAGRGVDIALGGSPKNDEARAQVLELGGLHIIGTERHDARRIDNQLRGRAGRQGDVGSSQFYVSMEDDIMRIFGSNRVQFMMEKMGIPEDMPIENKMVAKAIESAQTKVEGHNFDIRKHLLEYDDVINKQRETIYRKRNEILELTSPTEGSSPTEGELRESRLQGREEGEEQLTLKPKILDLINEEIEDVINFNMSQGGGGIKEILETLKTVFPLSDEDKKKAEQLLSAEASAQAGKTAPELIKHFTELAHKRYDELEEKINSSFPTPEGEIHQSRPMQQVEKSIYLRSIDTLWLEHIETLDYLKTGIGLRGYGQRDPLVEYKKESFHLFQELLLAIRKQVVYSIYKVGMGVDMAQEASPRNIRLAGAAKTMEKGKGLASNGRRHSRMSPSGEEDGRDENIDKVKPKPKDSSGKKVGRNDPCPCGSGKKYKKCCGR